MASRACRFAPEFPHLAGQSGAAIYKQLHDYRTGSRTHELMTDLAKALEEPVIADVAAYYAGAAAAQARTRRRLPISRVRSCGWSSLAIPRRNIPPCASCHRPGSGGPIETPILSEQQREYLVQQMQMYASGQRRNDVYGRMRINCREAHPGGDQGACRLLSRRVPVNQRSAASSERIGSFTLRHCPTPIHVLHAFEKKTQKTARRDLGLAAHDCDS